MNIAYIVNHAPLYGSNASLLNLLKGMKINGVNPLVILAYPGDFVAALQQENIPYQIVRHYFSIIPATKGVNILLVIPRIIFHLGINIIAIIRLYFFLRRKDIDLVHTNIGPDYIGYYTSRLLGVPHVWHIREYQKEDFQMEPIWGWNYFYKLLQKSYVIAITQGLYDRFKLSKRSKYSVVIYNGIRSKTQTAFILQKENYFLYVGRLENNKGVFNLLSTFAKLNDESVELWIAGTGEHNYVSFLKQFVVSQRLVDRVKFLGFRSDVDALMQKAKALIVPSINEGFGRITAEAMFNGCLVIGYKAAGTQEILEEKNLGLLYISEEDLLDHLNQVLSHKVSYFKEMLLRAQHEAIENYSTEINVIKTMDFYKKICIRNNKLMI